MILLIEVNHASVKGKLPAAVVRMDGLDADAALSVIVIFGRAHQRFVDEPLLFPALGEPVDHMADACFGNRVPAVFEAARIVRVDRDKADGAAQSRGMGAHGAVVPSGDVTGLLADQLGRLVPVQVNAEGLRAHLHSNQIFGLEMAMDLLALDEQAVVVGDALVTLPRFRDKA